MCFRAIDGEPIQKLGVNISWDGGEITSFTTVDGMIPPVQAPAGALLTVAVQRFDKSYKEIGSTLMPASNGLLTAISPSLVIETTTEKHDGAPGNAEEAIPKPTAADVGILSFASATVTTTAPSQTPLSDASSGSVPGSRTLPQVSNAPAAKQIAKPTSKHTAPISAPATYSAKSAPPQISGTTSTKDKPKTGRDKQGHPTTFYTQKVIDWWGSWRLPTFNLWGATAAQGTNPKSCVAVTADMVQQVQTLLAFAKEQTEYKYTEGTVGVLKSMADRTFKHKEGEKRSRDSNGLCYTYVKVALTRSKTIDGILGDKKLPKQSADEYYAMQDSASKAGPALLAKDFRDVTDVVPDPRWAAAGDVIVYEWSANTWVKRKKDKKNDKLPNHGHIDIRDYECYISDFIPAALHPSWVVLQGKNKNGGYPPGGKCYPTYANIRIYRKAFDPLPTQRIRAFLRCLREFECQSERDDSKRYCMLNCALPGMSERRFTSFRTHPWEGHPLPPKPNTTAAGAYQVLASTWQEKIEQGQIPDSGDQFSPAIQDRIAVIKIEDRKALHLIRSGKVQEAIESTTLPNEWTSLPGGAENAHRKAPDGQPMNMNYLLKLFDQYLTEERARCNPADV